MESRGHPVLEVPVKLKNYESVKTREPELERQDVVVVVSDV